MRPMQASEVADLLKQDADVTFIDVREPWEHQLASVPEARLIPMGEIAGRLDELEPERTTVVMCHHGNRSATVARFLEQHGFRNVVNLEGGIDGWSEQVDAEVPRY